MKNLVITIICISLFCEKGHSENVFKIFHSTREYAKANHVESADHSTKTVKISDARFFVYCCASEVVLENKNYKFVANFLQKNIKNLNFDDYDNIDSNNSAKEVKLNQNKIISNEKNPVGLSFPERSVVITANDFEIIIVLINAKLFIHRADSLIIDKNTGIYSIKDLCNISFSDKETNDLINSLFPNPSTD